MKPGVFITFEGGEGAGKTTQIALLANKLESLGYEVVKTLEPGGTPLGREIRKHLVEVREDPPSPTAELMLYGADRAHHVEKYIRPALGRGAVVLCDRYADATVAYQGYGRGIDLGLVRELNHVATGGLMPQRTLWFDMDPVEGVQRSLARQTGEDGVRESRFEEEAAEFHRRVRVGYAAIAASEPDRVKRIDAQGPIDEISLRVWESLADLFGGAA